MVCLQLQVDIAISGEQDPLTWAVTAGCSSFLLCSLDRNHSIKMRTASLSRKLKSVDGHCLVLSQKISNDIKVSGNINLTTQVLIAAARHIFEIQRVSKIISVREREFLRHVS